MKFCSQCGGEIYVQNPLSEFPDTGDEHEDPATCIRNLRDRMERIERNVGNTKRNYVIKGWARDSQRGLNYHGVCTISAYSRQEALDEFRSKRWRFKLFVSDNDTYNPLGSDCYAIDVEPE